MVKYAVSVLLGPDPLRTGAVCSGDWLVRRAVDADGVWRGGLMAMGQKSALIMQAPLAKFARP